MYIENKSVSLNGQARIGRVRINKTGRTIYYHDQVFTRIVGGGYNKANYRDATTGDHYWISGATRRGDDRLYDSDLPVEIDEDVREEYWTKIRQRPERVADDRL